MQILKMISSSKVFPKTHIFNLLLTFLSLHSIDQAIALPDDIEMDRYMLSVTSYAEEGRLDKVEFYLEKIEALLIEPPAEYYYYQAKVLNKKGDMQKEREALEKYVSLAGKEAKYYKQALVAITNIEETATPKKHLTSQSKQAALLKAVREDKESSDAEYANNLKQLYLTNSFNDALIRHINEILATNAYTGTKFKPSKTNNGGVVYSIKITPNKEILTLRNDKNITPERMSTEKLKVFGQNHFLNYECNYTKSHCWIKKPDNYSKWIQLGYDQTAAKAVSKALSRLILSLQHNETH